MRRLSIRAAWTLRFTLALLISISIFGGFTYDRISDRTERDARQVLDLEMQELVDVLNRTQGNPVPVQRRVARKVLVTDPELKIGVQVFDGRGERLFASGSLERHEVPLPPPEARPTADERVFQSIELGEEAYPYLVKTVAVDAEGEIVAYLQGALYTRRFVRNARDVRDIYLYSIPAVLLVTIGLGTLLARRSLRPLEEMNSTARRISGTHLEETIPTTGSGDELDALAHTLNEMIGRIRRSVDRMRRFSGNAAHQLRTPLNALRSRLEVTLEQPRSAEEYQKIIAETVHEMSVLSESVHGLMRLSQSEAGLAPDQRQPVAIVPLLEEVAEFFEPLASEAGLALACELPDEAVVPGDASWLHECFANLVHNAILYSPEGGTIHVRAHLDDAQLTVEVADEGIGIAPEERTRIFEPFHRVSSGTAPGVGLGLPLAREIARAHGGDIRVESELGVGSTFFVTLPRRA